MGAIEELAEHEKANGNGADVRKSQADVLVEIAITALDLFHDGDIAYADAVVGDHRETFAIRSKGCRDWMRREFYRQKQKSIRNQFLDEALGVLEASARYDGDERSVSLRVADEGGDTIFLDLGDSTWRAVQVTREGWELVSKPPVRFRRSPSTRPLPEPTRGGSVGLLRPLMNVSSDAAFYLLVAFMLAALTRRWAYPVLALYGEHGSAKTAMARALRTVVDPSKAPDRGQPKEELDLMVAAENSHILAFDNLSYLPAWLSDGFCRLVYGAGFGRRTLYTDAEETIFTARRPVIINGISELADRPDLVDRSLVLHLPRIDEDRRITETEFWSQLAAIRPRVLGALLDATAAALRNEPGLTVPDLPRLADFARWIVAAESSLGWKRGIFLGAFKQNHSAANAATLEGSMVAQAVLRMPLAESWSGTATELLAALDGTVADDVKRARTWPKSGRTLSNLLRRFAPALREENVEIVFDEREPGGGRRIVTVRRVSSSQAKPENPWARDDGDEGDDESRHSPDQHTEESEFEWTA